jgi:hypothetical protein
MTLLDEIIDGATDDAVSTSNLLRKVQVVAHRLQAAEIKTWIQRELNGYDEIRDLPKYRESILTNVRGHRSGPFQSSATQVVSEAGVPAAATAALFSVNFNQTLAELEELSRSGKELGVPWDPVHIGHYNSWIDKGQVPHLAGFYLFSADRVVTPGLLRGIIDSVRNTALDFALNLQSADPTAGAPEGPTVADAELQQVVWNVTNNIYGDGAQVAHGNDIRQKTMIVKGDIEGLLRAAREIGLSDEGKEELASAATAPEGERPSRLRSFLNKVSEGSFLVGTGVAANVAASQIEALIEMYLGHS